MSNTPTPTSIAARSECAVVTMLKESLSPKEWEILKGNAENEATNEIENDRAPSILTATQCEAIKNNTKQVRGHRHE